MARRARCAGLHRFETESNGKANCRVRMVVVEDARDFCALLRLKAPPAGPAAWGASTSALITRLCETSSTAMRTILRRFCEKVSGRYPLSTNIEDWSELKGTLHLSRCIACRLGPLSQHPVIDIRATCLDYISSRRRILAES